MVQAEIADLLWIEQVSHSYIQHVSEFKLTRLFPNWPAVPKQIHVKWDHVFIITARQSPS